MSKDVRSLRFIVEKIDDALDNLAQFGTVERLLSSKMGYDATLMCILQIGETLKKKLSSELCERYKNTLPIEQSYWTRNYIAHDYEGVSKLIIEDLLRGHLPKLKKDIEAILESLEETGAGKR